MDLFGGNFNKKIIIGKFIVSDGCVSRDHLFVITFSAEKVSPRVKI